MINAVKKVVRLTDATVARTYLALVRERNALLGFLFHSLFRNSKEIAAHTLDPLERTTVAKFRQFIEYFLESGYRFINPADLLRPLSPDGKYALITFDDGYFNNHLALPVLKEYQVPATFFISTNHVRDNKSFWWDVLYRQRVEQGASERQIYRESLELKRLTTEQIEERLTRLFGPAAFRPRSDIDRPFNPSELREFAQNPYVHLGNHTANHGILTNYTPEEARKQIHCAQEWLTDLTGVRPIAIAYPNGAHDSTIVQICREEGLKIGVTIRPQKFDLTTDQQSQQLLRIGRFCPHDEAPMLTQCRTCRSDLLLYGALRSGYLRFMRGKTAQ